MATGVTTFKRGSLGKDVDSISRDIDFLITQMNATNVTENVLSSATDADILSYDATNNYWINRTITQIVAKITGAMPLGGNWDAGAYTVQSDHFQVDEYMDMVEVAVPATPAANTLRLYVEDYKGFSFYSFKDATGMVRKIVRDSVFVGKNVTGSTIAANRIVYASGAADDVPTIALAKADAAATMPAIGVTIESVANGAFGRVMQVGQLENINTSALSVGDVLYVSKDTAGVPTTTAPAYPNLRQEIGTVLVNSATVGSIQIVARAVFNDALIDHDGLLDLTNDVHTQYIPVDASRGFSANFDAGAYQIRALQFYADGATTSGGYHLGDTTQLYQSAENVIRTPDSLTVDATLQAEHLYSTDDAVITDQLTVGNILFSGTGVDESMLVGTHTPTTSAVFPISLDYNPVTTSGDNYYYIGLRMNVRPTFTGAPTDGYVRGIYSSVLRAESGETQEYAEELVSFGGQYGHVSPLGAATTAAAYGINLEPKAQAGTITNMYGLYVGDTLAGGTVTNNWGVYIKDASMVNYFAGRVGMGVSPSGPLHVRGAQQTVGDLSWTVRLDDTTAMAADVGPGIRFVGKYTAAGSYVDFGGIGGYKESAVEANTSSYLGFYNTTHPATTPTEKMRLGSAGDLSLGSNKLLFDKDGFGSESVNLYSDTDNELKTDDNFSAANFYGAEYFYHTGDADTYWRFQTNQLDLVAGGATGFTCNATGAALYGVTPTAQAAHIADPAGGATVDAESRTAINAILVALENIGITAAA